MARNIDFSNLTSEQQIAINNFFNAFNDTSNYWTSNSRDSMEASQIAFKNKINQLEKDILKRYNYVNESVSNWADIWDDIEADAEKLKQAELEANEKFKNKELKRLSKAEKTWEIREQILAGLDKNIDDSLKATKNNWENLQSIKILNENGKATKKEVNEAEKEYKKDFDKYSQIMKIRLMTEMESAKSDKEKYSIQKSNFDARRKVQDQIDKKYKEELAYLEVRKDLNASEKKIAAKKIEAEKKHAEELADARYGGETGNYSAFIDSTFGGKARNSELVEKLVGKTRASEVAKDLVTNNGDKVSSIISEGMKASPELSLVIKLLKLINTGITKLYTKASAAMKDYFDTTAQYSAKIATRLIGLDDAYNKNANQFTKSFINTFGVNYYINQKGLMEKLSSLVESGVAYNLEQRTIISELSDRMVSTFDTLDGTLLRLSRLNQADLTIAGLGIEGKLTEFLSNTFQDTSYLTDVYDSINSTLIDATSQLNYDEATEFTYNVQKWLGSLYSLGMSQEGVQKIAQGINYLGTGNFEAFNGDDSLRTLFALASNGAYSDLLVNRMSADNVEVLLENIVTYLADISTDTNQVTKNVRAGIYGGLSVSDITAVSNLSTTDFSKIANNNTYTWAENKDTLNKYLQQASAFTPGATLYNNLQENLNYVFGARLALDSIGSEVTGAARDILSGKTPANALQLNAAENGNAFSFYSTVAKNQKAIDWVSKLDLLGGGAAAVSLASLLSDIGIKNLVTSGWDTATDYFNFSNPLSNNLMGLIDNAQLSTMILKSRGDSYAGTKGVISGISSSSLSKLDDIYTGMSLYEAAQVITDNGMTVSGNTGNTSLKSVDDLYTALFVNKQTVRVSVATLESQAQTDLSKTTITANKDDIKDIRENVLRFKDDTSYKLDEIYRKMVLGY